MICSRHFLGTPSDHISIESGPLHCSTACKATPPPMMVEATSPPMTVKATPTPTVEFTPSPKVGCKCCTRCHSKRGCACKQHKIRCTKLCHSAHSCVNVSTTSCDTVHLTHWVEHRGPAQSDLDVPTRSQLEILTTNAWLDDSLMNLGQKMFSQQYPHISGFQSVVPSEKFAFIPQPYEFIQQKPLDCDFNYWMSCSNCQCL